MPLLMVKRLFFKMVYSVDWCLDTNKDNFWDAMLYKKNSGRCMLFQYDLSFYLAL